MDVPPLQKHLSPHWRGVLALLAMLSAILVAALGGCCIQVQRAAQEGGDGDQTTPITGAETWVDIQADADVDGAAMPLSELGGGE